jgi:hypothetical protein
VALHPEQGESEIGDKCHQLCAAVQYLNQHAKRAFVLGCHCSFDEGGSQVNLNTTLCDNTLPANLTSIVLTSLFL